MRSIRPLSAATLFLTQGLSVVPDTTSKEIERELRKYGVDMDSEAVDELVADLVRKLKERRVARSTEMIRRELEERGLLDE